MHFATEELLAERHPSVTVIRCDGRWEFAREEIAPWGGIVDTCSQTDRELLESRPLVCMPSGVLADIARQLGRDPERTPWYRERVLLERVAANDRSAVRALLDDGMSAHEAWSMAPMLAAFEASAWAVARELFDRGASVVAPPGSVWAVNDFAVHSLDDSDDALALLDAMLARGVLDPREGLLRCAQGPRVVRRLVAGGASPDATGPAGGSALDPALVDATALSVTVVRGRFEAAEALLSAGASMDHRDPRGRTALALALFWGRADGVRWLVDHGASE